MSQDNAQNAKQAADNRRRRWLWFVAIAVGAVAAVLLCLMGIGLLRTRGVDARLAAIEAARAVPDEQNAALLYDRIMADYDDAYLEPAYLTDQTEWKTRKAPWRSEDWPELALWINERSDVIARLLEACGRKECRFPISECYDKPAKFFERSRYVHKWAYLLVRAANNDIAEGRVESGLRKYFAVSQIARHLCQQPVTLDILRGWSVQAVALWRIRGFLAEGPCDETHLVAIEASLPAIADRWSEFSPEVIEVEHLHRIKERRNLPRRLWSYLRFGIGIWPDTEWNKIREGYLRRVAERRATRIMVGLRRYKNRTGLWPRRLQEIEDELPSETFVDPLNGGSFAYGLFAGRVFTLYSKGVNNIDEAGRRNSTFDVNSLRVIQHEDDISFWP